MNESVGFYLHISYWYKYRATFILLKQKRALEKYTFKQQQVQATKYSEVRATKYDKLSLQVQCPAQSGLQQVVFCWGY